MPVAVEGEPRAFWPAVPCCPQHGVARKLVEAIPGINEVAVCVCVCVCVCVDVNFKISMSLV